MDFGAVHVANVVLGRRHATLHRLAAVRLRAVALAAPGSGVVDGVHLLLTGRKFRRFRSLRSAADEHVLSNVRMSKHFTQLSFD